MENNERKIEIKTAMMMMGNSKPIRVQDYTDHGSPHGHMMIIVAWLAPC